MAQPTHIELSDDGLLAEYVDIERFKGFLQQRIAIGPDLLACLIRDGQIAEASAGGHFAIGGIWRSIKDAIGGQHAIRLLIADLKPFQLSTTGSALTRDHVEIKCEFTIELQVNPERPANVLGMMKSHGVLTKDSILERLTPHLSERVLNASIRQVDALDLRGNKGLQDKIQADAMSEVERIASDTGMMARVVSVNWGLNEEEKAQIEKRAQEREQEAIERDYQILNRSIEREAESTILKLTTDKDIEEAKVTTEDELRRLILSNELNFIDARETGVRIQEMKALEHELQLNRTQRLDGLKAALEQQNHQIDMVRSMAGRRDVEMDLETHEREHTLAVRKIESEIRVVERAIFEADRRQAMELAKLEQIQALDLAARAHEDQIRTMRGLQDVEIDAESRRLDLNIKSGDATHRREMDKTLAARGAELDKIKALKDVSPEQIMAIQAGFSPAVANIMIEQARARGVDSQAQMALMREMIEQAQAGRVDSEAQARAMFEAGMQGAVGVAQGVGTGVGAGAAAGRGGAGGAARINPDAPDGNTECPDCHRVIPAAERFCRYCGRQMRQ